MSATAGPAQLAGLAPQEPLELGGYLVARGRLENSMADSPSSESCWASSWRTMAECSSLASMSAWIRSRALSPARWSAAVSMRMLVSLDSSSSSVADASG